MKTVDLSIRIKCLIEMALEDHISWLTLDTIINELTPTLEKSKQITKAFLKEFGTHQLICMLRKSDGENDILEDGNDDINEGTSINDENKIILQSYSKKQDILEIIKKKQLPEVQGDDGFETEWTNKQQVIMKVLFSKMKLKLSPMKVRYLLKRQLKPI